MSQYNILTYVIANLKYTILHFYYLYRDMGFRNYIIAFKLFADKQTLLNDRDNHGTTLVFEAGIPAVNE